LEETKKKEDLDPAAVLAAVEKKLAEECHFAVNKVEDMEKKGFWSNCKRKLFKQCGLCKACRGWQDANVRGHSSQISN